MKNKIRYKLDEYGKQKTPILFILDFKAENSFIYPLNQIPSNILYQFDNKTNFTISQPKLTQIDNIYNKIGIPYTQYQFFFNQVQNEIKEGNCYFLNLTFPTKVNIIMSLDDIFRVAKSKFKLLIGDFFVCFSPERFVKIKGNKIFTYPIKGTIDASIKNAENKLLNNIKEHAEHVMIVDLLRNDLGKIGTDVKVNYFRKVETIYTGEKNLLHTSSEIEATLEENWADRLGTILSDLLPAGSISGTPKQKTLEIIDSIEQQYHGYKRGFFCGICGYFDGKRLDSFVMIRFLEKQNRELIYKSGGGITADSEIKSEYKELLDKVYVPIF